MNDAIAKLLKVIADDPQRWDAYQQLARLMVLNEEFGAAEEYFLQAIRLAPKTVQLHLQLGELHMRTQQFKAAHACFKQAISLDAKQAQIYYLDAQALKNLGRVGEAILRLRTAYKLAPSIRQAFAECADLLHQQQQWQEAEDVLKQAIAAHPNDALFYFRLGMIAQQVGDSTLALASFKHAITLQPKFADAHHQLAILLHATQQFEQAIDSFNQAIKWQPALPSAYNNRGVVLCQIKRYELAIVDFKQAIQLNPGYASAYCNLGVALFENGEHDAAYGSLEVALRHEPSHAQAQYILSKLKLARGEYASGWKLYESRWKVLALPTDIPNIAAWRGKSDLLGKTILVFAEQTLSDVVQFCRYIPLLKQFKPNQIVVQVPEALYALLHQHWASDEWIHVIKVGTRIPHVDVCCPLLSLPLAFKTKLDTIPAPLPYLSVADKQQQPWQQLLGPSRRLRVGLNWCGDASNKHDQARSIPLFMLTSLLKMEVEWHSLQKEFRREDHIMLKRFPMLECHHPQLTDFTQTAGLIMQMDLIISVDTAVAHLAAALGKPVWLLLPQHTHFRWLENDENNPWLHRSPWYPNMRLFRMQAYQQWEDVADDVHQALTEYISQLIRQKIKKLENQD